jgi:hypothetical protein
VEVEPVEITNSHKAVIVMHSQLLFMRYAFPQELTIPDDREDLPKGWLGQKIMSEKQRIMICDRRRQRAYRTSRKISKCVPGHVSVMDYDTGKSYTIDEIFQGAHPTILTLGEGYALKPTRDYSICRNGVQDVYRLTLAYGQTVDLTGNHPVLTGRGWVPIEELDSSDLVAAPRAMPVSGDVTSSMGEDVASILGYIIGDGGVTTKAGGISFSKTDRVVLEHLGTLLSGYGAILVKKKGDDCTYRVVNAERIKGKRSEIRPILEEHGVWGKYSYEKTVPPSIFTQPLPVVRAFLRALFTCDGMVTLRENRTATVAYASTSSDLARGVRHLLLRFGIGASISFAENEFHGCWTVRFCDKNDIRRFYDRIGFTGIKQERLEATLGLIEGSGSSKHDVVPSNLAQELMEGNGDTIGSVASRHGIRLCPEYRGVSRDKCGRIAEATGNHGLSALVGSDVGWYKVAGVEFIGQMETYDLSVPPTSNFVANDIIVHNTPILISSFLQWSFWHKGAPTDGLLHCPREHHLTNIRLKLEKKIARTPIFNILVESINRQTGVIVTTTGITWFMRIEGKTGTGESMVGPAARYEIGDEQDYAAWGPFNERQQALLPGAYRVLGGVPRGVQNGPFWTMANRKEYEREWSVFRGLDGYNMFINPIYRSEQARKRLELDAGGKDTQTYQTQVLGLDGAKVFSSFPYIPTVVQDFKLIEITGVDVDSGILHADLQGLPLIPGDMHVIVGDMGRSPAPTEIGYFRLFKGAWIETARIHLTVSDGAQIAEAIHALDRALPRPADVIVIDAHGQGTSPYDFLHKSEKWVQYNYAERVIDAGFNTYIEDERRLVHSTCKHVVRSVESGWYCDGCGIPIFSRQDLEPSRIQMKQWAFAELKDNLAAGQRWLMDQAQKTTYPPMIISAHDEYAVLSLEGTTEKETATGAVQWDAPSRHIIDMLLCMSRAARMLAQRETQTDTLSWLEECGWSGGQGGGSLPWEVQAFGKRNVR